MKNTLRIDHANGRIIMDRTFAKCAEDTRSEEYRHLQSVRQDYPTYTVVRKQIIALVQRLLQHSSAAVTQRYIGIEPQRIESAIEGHAQLL